MPVPENVCRRCWDACVMVDGEPVCPCPDSVTCPLCGMEGFDLAGWRMHVSAAFSIAGASCPALPTAEAAERGGEAA